MLLIGLAKAVALIAVAGGAGLAIGYGLSKLSGNDEAVTPVGGAGTTTTTSDAEVTTAAETAPPATASVTSTATTATTPTTPTTTTPRPTGALAQVDVRVLGAVLRPAGAPSGVTPQNGELVMRVRAQNGASQSVTIQPPVLRIGSTKTEIDPATLTPETEFGTLAAGETKAVTVRFEISGEATPKATRDRRARIEIAGGSVPLRIKVAAQ